jgi:hypothetical protein
MINSGDKEKSELLNSIGIWIGMDHTEYDEKGQAKVVRKTYVISNGALRAIKHLTNYYKVSRDKMVSDVIDWFTLYYGEIADSLEDERVTREALNLISDLHSQMLNAHKKLNKIIGDDAIVQRFSHIEARMSDLINDVELYLRDGKEIDSKPL